MRDESSSRAGTETEVENECVDTAGKENGMNWEIRLTSRRWAVLSPI